MSCCCPPDKDGDVIVDTPVQKLLHRRRCTDCCCCLLFFVVLTGAALVAMAAFQVGDPALLSHGKDYTGQVCGVARGVADRPKIYYPRLARDLQEYQQSKGVASIEGAPSWALPIYAVCVAECPEAGETVEDYGCLQRASGCKWAGNPLSSRDRFGQWLVGVGTRDVLNRCVPFVEEAKSRVELCAMPSCTEAHKPCDDGGGGGAPDSWRLTTDEERLNCARVVTLAVTRTYSAPDAGYVDTLIGQSVGGLFGALTSLTRASMEVAVFGVLVAIVVNLLVLCLLRCAIRTLFCVATLAVTLLLLALDVTLFAKAGSFDLLAATNATFGALSSASTWAIDLAQDAAASAEQDEMADLAATAEAGTATSLAQAHIAADAYATSHPLLRTAPPEQQPQYQLAAYVTTAITVIVVLVVCLLRSRLERSLQICERATQAVFFMPGLLSLPLCAMFLSLAVLSFFVVVAAYVATPDPNLMLSAFNELTAVAAEAATTIANEGLDAAQTIADASEENLHIEAHHLELPHGLLPPNLEINATLAKPQLLQRCAFVYELGVALWLLFFVDAVVYTTIATAVGYWYFVGAQPDDDGDGDVDGDGIADKSFFPLVNSTCLVVRYHLGSMAFGSFILAAIRLVRLAMVWLDEQMRRSPGFRDALLVKLALGCIHCVLWCFERCVKYLTRFTYVFIALEGLAFCPSAVQTFRLISEFPLQMVANEYARAVLTLLQSLLPPLASGWLAYLSIVNGWRFSTQSALTPLLQSLETADSFLLPTWMGEWNEDEPPNAIAVALAALAVSYYVTSAFTIVYGAAIDTLFVCMFRDEYTYDGKYGQAHMDSHAAFMHADEESSRGSVSGSSPLGGSSASLDERMRKMPKSGKQMSGLI